MQKRYGEALYSIPIDLDFGCPNRKNDGSGGCTFCPKDGVRSAQTKEAKTLEGQVNDAIAFAQKRYHAKAFALYIQAYTGTFASLIEQKEAYARVLGMYPFKALHVGTRPDCLSPQTLEYLKSLNQQMDVNVELGVQSMHDETLHAIHRGHNAEQSKIAIETLHAYGLRVFAHLIIGFPNEKMHHYERSVDALVKLGIDGIKFHNLHIIKDTALAQSYLHQPFHTLNEYEYAEVVMHLIRRIPSDIPIMRLATDTPERHLIAPHWQMPKGQFGSYITQSMIRRCIKQGDFYEIVAINNEIPPFVELKDGSTTFFSKEFSDYYHPKSGAHQQAEQLFIRKSQIEERLKKADVRVLDIGFGMGYNSFALLKSAMNIAHNCLHVSAIEQDKRIIKQSVRIIKEPLHVKMLENLYTNEYFETKAFSIKLFAMEARYAITLLHEPFDIIFLDPFLESNNASLVTVDFFKRLFLLLKEDGVLVTSTSLHVSQVGMRLAGFETTVVNIEGSDIKGVVSHKRKKSLEEHREPYRDPDLVLRDKEIEANRQKILVNNLV